MDPGDAALFARALLDQGRADEALAAERRVLLTCTMADSTCAAGSASASGAGTVMKRRPQVVIMLTARYARLAWKYASIAS